MKYYEFLDVDTMPYVHIRHGEITSCLCGEVIKNDFDIIDKAQNKKVSRLLAAKIQEDLEDTNSVITVCRHCVGALF
jgi:hypothetical protein